MKRIPGCNVVTTSKATTTKGMTMTMRVTWTFDVEDAETAREAAEYVWREVFERGTPGPDDACFFDVEEDDGTITPVDLAD